MTFTKLPRLVVKDKIPPPGFVNGANGNIGDIVISYVAIINVSVGQRIFMAVGASEELSPDTEVVAIDTVNKEITLSGPLLDQLVGAQLQTVTQSGKISKVRVVNEGAGYTKLPQIFVPEPLENFDTIDSNDRKKAKLISYSKSIGQIRSLKIIDQGLEYQSDIPIPLIPVSAILTDVSTAFLPSELVYDAYYTYPLDIHGNPIYTDGPHAYVKSFDATNNLIEFDRATAQYKLITEQNVHIVSETNDFIIHEAMNYDFSYGALIKGEKSQSTAKFLIFDRGNILVNKGTILNRKAFFKTNDSYLSSSAIKLHNGAKIQDFSYIIKTLSKSSNSSDKILTLSEFGPTVKSIAHPAGYRLFADVALVESKDIPFSVWQRVDKTGKIVGIGTLLKLYLGTLYHTLTTECSHIQQIIPFANYISECIDTFIGFRPSELDKIKFDLNDTEIFMFMSARFDDWVLDIFNDTYPRKYVPRPTPRTCDIDNTIDLAVVDCAIVTAAPPQPYVFGGAWNDPFILQTFTQD
jgi:hypothetical protein